MKKAFTLVFICVAVNLQAQKVYQEHFTISCSDSAYNFLFLDNPNLNQLKVTYERDSAIAVRLFFKKQQNVFPYSLLDLSFEGDRHILDVGFKNFKLPKPPKLSLDYLAKTVDSLGEKTGFDLTTIIQRDSLHYQFSVYTRNKTITSVPSMIFRKIETSDAAKAQAAVHDTVSLHRPKYKGEIALLQAKLGQSLRATNLAEIKDSALVMTGIVTADGVLSDLKLQFGEKSAFSEEAMIFIRKEAKYWWPAALDSGRNVRSLVKFFVKLQTDGTIKFSSL